LGASDIWSLASSGNNIYAGTFGHGVFLSTNNGISWSPLNVGLTNLNIYSLTASNYMLFAGTINGGLFSLTIGGTVWTERNNGFTSLFVSSIAFSGGNMYAGFLDAGIYKSTNNSVNWFAVNNGLANHDVQSTAVIGTNIYAGTAGGVYLSTNNGASWNVTGLMSNIISLAVSGTNLFASNYESVYLSTNNGANWINKSQGFNISPVIFDLFITNDYIYAGTSLNSVWRRSLSDIIGVQNIATEIPLQFSLKQNYPNPFNSMCNVQFSMCNAGNVKLVVYDVQGREVRTLVNERLQAGTYETSFDGSMLNSGVYFYKLTTDGFTETKRMILIK
jgi:hypothetical protein